MLFLPSRRVLVFLALWFGCGIVAQADQIVVLPGEVPVGRVVALRIDLTEAARQCGIEQFDPHALRFSVPAQFVSNTSAGNDPAKAFQGILLCHLPEDFQSRHGGRILVSFDENQHEVKDKTQAEPFDGIIRNDGYEIVQKPDADGGFPSRITFLKSGKQVEAIEWMDRLHKKELGGFLAANHSGNTVERIADGPIATVVRVSAEYGFGDPKRPSSEPKAVYDWFYFHGSPLVLVMTKVEQKQPFEWDEFHCLELHLKGKELNDWAVENPPVQGELKGEDKTYIGTTWALMHDGENGIGAVFSGNSQIYDGKNFGPYLLPNVNSTWHGWSTKEHDQSAWLWIGSADDPIQAIRSAEEGVPSLSRAVATTQKLLDRIVQLENTGTAAAGEERTDLQRRAMLARCLQASGRIEKALQAAEGNLSDDYLSIRSGQMEALFRQTDSGLELVTIFDLQANCQLAAVRQPSLFQVELNRPSAEGPAEKDEEAKPQTAKLVADQGWGSVEVQREEGKATIRFTQPVDPQLAGLAVTVHATPDPEKNRLVWSIEVQNDSADWSLASVVFPQVALADQGEAMSLLVPQGSGDVEVGICRRNQYQFRSSYPNGWCTMAFEAVYCPTNDTGFYWGMHDPLGSTKYISAKVDSGNDSLTLAFEHPVPNATQAGVDYQLPGEAVWLLFRGDWFDASMIYRDWVVKHARWYPKLSDEGREDTPLWMRELPGWALMSGKPKDIVPAMKKFREYLGVPVGIHWYCWHQIPFDNDYPHYFPTVDGFAEAVAELKKANVHTMPYINGRLWDNHDREDQDFEFTAKALPAATKEASGEPYRESYGSMEKDGTKVELSPMCPATELWQEKISQTIARLFSECDVDGVYVDQVAAASAVLCFDPTHGHPLGGGSWWNESYWKMFETIRAEKPADRMLTTECNAEPFTQCFDGYLSWHWQNDGQVPAFSAVYGGAIQMFGRAFQGDSWKGDAMRMKVGQQLCYGEQIGWITPAVVDDEKDGPVFRQAVRLRYALRRYFYAGQMARPPKLEGEVPTITADWRWGGSCVVTTPVVLTGAWRLPKENRTVLVLVNVSEKPVATTVTFSPADYGFDAKQVLKATIRTDLDDSGKGETFSIEAGRHDVTLPPLSAQVWELEGE